MSPSGGSTLTTSAPRSASMRAANGPARTRERSSTRSDASGKSIALAAGGRFARSPARSDRGRRRVALVVGVNVDLRELDLAGQHGALPLLVLGLARVELRHHLVSEQLEA